MSEHALPMKQVDSVSSKEPDRPSAPVRVMDFRGSYKGGGGPDKTILLSACRHDPAAVDVLVTYIKQPRDHDFQIAAKARELKIHYLDFEDRKFFDPVCLARLNRVIRSRKIQLLHTHDDKTSMYGCLLKLLNPGLRLLHTCHSHAEYSRDNFRKTRDYLRFRIRKNIVVRLLKFHDKPLLTIANDTKKRLVRAGLQEEGVEILYNGIDADYWQRKDIVPVLKEELGVAPHQVLIGTVARITYDKDLPTFFRVAKRVAEQCPAARFVIVGDGYGNELEQARKQVEDAGLAEVLRFTGHRTDLREIYASFDIFLMTSLTEGLPNTMLEAMAMGNAVVSTRVGGVPELVVDGESGLLCSIGDDDALAGATLRLLADEALRRRFAEAARQRILSRFDFKNRVKALERYYLDLVGSTA